jgi:hypothetical protein
MPHGHGLTDFLYQRDGEIIAFAQLVGRLSKPFLSRSNEPRDTLAQSRRNRFRLPVQTIAAVPAVAILPAASTALAPAAGTLVCEADPIFAAIEKYRASSVEFIARCHYEDNLAGRARSPVTTERRK